MKKLFSLVLLCALMAAGSTCFAATHEIQFGGNLGFTYSPSQLTVQVGDTIFWRGDFTQHPLSSVSVPSGAQAFSQVTGSEFAYVVAVAGDYVYHCNFHFGAGMQGQIMASGTSGVEADAAPVLSITSFPNPSADQVTFSFAPAAGTLRISIIGMNGEAIASPRDEEVAAGRTEFTFPCDMLPVGSYLCRLDGNSGVRYAKFSISR
jgi:plastocyanin